MSKKITPDQWASYLNGKTGGVNCPVCHHCHWQTQQTEAGDIADVVLLDQHYADTVIGEPADFCAVFDAALDDGKETPEPAPKKKPAAPTILTHLVVMRCGHCGWIGLFDRAFVEAGIHPDGGAHGGL